jgi:adenine-specific DNA-methyltransferase
LRGPAQEGYRRRTGGIFDKERRVKPDISFENLAAHIYFTETKTPMNHRKRKNKSPFLGIYDGTAYALLYNGILGDKSVSGRNVLTHNTLKYIKREIETCEKRMARSLNTINWRYTARPRG